MEKTASDFAHIKGWGIDADPKNDPTYPMRARTNDESIGERPSLQPEDIEVLHSTERPNVTAAFGTTSPPKGLSGMIRRLAFKKSENQYGHWLPLVFADRVGEVEGIVEDLMRGHIPNIFAEKGYGGKWKHDKSGVMMKIGMAAALGAGAFLLLSGSGKDKKAKKKKKNKNQDYEWQNAGNNVWQPEE